MAAESVNLVVDGLKHVARHHPGYAINCATMNGAEICFSASGGEVVHYYLQHITEGACATTLHPISVDNPSVANLTWNPLADGVAEFGLNVTYAFANPACLASYGAQCFAALNTFAPCALKAVLQTAVDMTKAAATPDKVGAAFAGVGATLGVFGLFGAAVYCWKSRHRADYQNLDQERAVNNSL